jgi:hypothetical protein
LNSGGEILMMKWEPALALPNVDFIDPVESSFAVIAGCDDRRVKELQESHPILKTFLSRFTNEFDVSVRPSVFLVRKDAPKSAFTIDAIASFRDIVAMSTVP